MSEPAPEQPAPQPEPQPSAAPPEITPAAEAEPETQGLLYNIDDIPAPGETVALGFQHYLTMFGSTVAIPLILAPAFGIEDKPKEKALLIATMFFVSGITTLLQTTFGNRLPIVQGGTFSFLAPTFAICGMAGVADQGDWQVRMQHVQGAIILGAVVEIVMGLTGLAGRVLRFVGPITIAPTIALIGLALFKFGAPIAGLDWWTGGLTIALIILFSQVLRRTHRAFELYPILLALVGAWAVAAGLTFAGVFTSGDPSYVDLSKLEDAPWVRVPYPFQWGMPQFTLAAFVGMIAGYLASMVESIGDYFACARLAGAPPPDAKTVNRGITFEGIGCLIAGIIGTGNGTTSYSENIGAIGLTRVGSRRVVQAGAAIMLVLGLVGKFGALFTTIPQPIVGGMYCALFGMIAAVGLSNLQLVDLNSSRNLFILGFAFFMGLSLPEYVDKNPIKLFEPPVVAEADPQPERLGDEEAITPDPDAVALLGVKTDATVGQARAVSRAVAPIYMGAEALPGTDPARPQQLAEAVEAVSQRVAAPAPREPTPWEQFLKILEDVINTLGKTGMAVGALLALVLDNIIPGTPRERGLVGSHGA